MKAIEVWGNFFNTNLVASAILWIIIFIIGLTILSDLLDMLNNIRRTIKALADHKELNYIRMQNQGLKELDLNQEINCTNDLLDFIVKMIEDEVMNTLRSVIVLNEPYVMSNLDVDVAKISTTVFDGIDKHIFSKNNEELIITKDYVMTYITKKASIMMLDATNAHNDALRGRNMETDENE